MTVGTDLIHISQIAESIARFGDRYVRRLFTEQEIAFCQRDPALAVPRFAARFAAKEATVKALRPTGTWPDWRSIEVHRTPAGWCEIVLHGQAAALARDAGLTSFVLSMSHDGDYASAVVVAT